jgi:hypothetical protein
MALCAAQTIALSVQAQSLVSPQDLRNFAAPTDPHSALYLEKPGSEGAGVYNVGVWFSYANQLLVLESTSGTETTPLEHQYSVDYVGSLGLTERVTLGLAVPTVVYQVGDDEAPTATDEALPKTAFGDVRADLKLTLLHPGSLGSFGLGLLARGTVPTAQDQSFAGHPEPTGELRWLTELSYLTTSIQTTAGIRLRDEVEAASEALGHDLPWGVAALWTFLQSESKSRLVAALEAHGNIGLRPSFAAEIASPVLTGASLRWLAEDWSLIAGLEAGINGGLGGPRWRGVLSAGYAPRVKDADQDGLEDHVDQCPVVAEDLDGFQDSDGCPEVDNDGDGVSDTDDRCPKELEDLDDFEDSDGCPDPDNDGDGVPDASDACVLVAGTASEAPKYHGCPDIDTDGDGIYDDKDRCLNKAEDRDGFQDDDGCPDPDNDRDRIPDKRDACPDEKGQRRSDPRLNGCPNPDQDGDTFDDKDDRCPKQPETFNGFEDDDGCPDSPEDAKPLISVSDGPAGPGIELSHPIEFLTTAGGVEIAQESLPLLRAIGSKLNEHPRWVLLVGVRAATEDADAAQQAINKSFSVVFALGALTHRDGLAESVSFEAVKQLPKAQDQGIGLMVLARDKRKPGTRRR